jgi:predicted metal-binding membrane protein
VAQGRVPGLNVSGAPSTRIARARPDQLALLGALLALTVAAWLVTGNRMGSMESMPGMELGSLGFYVTVWVVMMAAMMLPSAAPTVLTYDRLRGDHRTSGRGAPADATALFLGGYLLVWTAAGLLAYALFELVRSLDPQFLAWDEAGRYVTAGVIIAAVAYQLTPAKRASLHKCRSPSAFLDERWRDGRPGALELGVRHGAWCLGCCWALMAALFAVGLMSLGWMAVIAALIAAERLLPWPNGIRGAIAVFLLVLGLGIALVPSDVPGFSEPGGAMEGDGGHGESMPMMR